LKGPGRIDGTRGRLAGAAMISPRDLDLLRCTDDPDEVVAIVESGAERQGREGGRMHDWIETHAAAIAARAPRELEALVAVSSPSGDVKGAEEAAAVAAALAPEDAEIERVECSAPDHAPHLLIRTTGAGTKRILLLGHLDTVISHADHRPVR